MFKFVFLDYGAIGVGFAEGLHKDGSSTLTIFYLIRVIVLIKWTAIGGLRLSLSMVPAFIFQLLYSILLDLMLNLNRHCLCHNTGSPFLLVNVKLNINVKLKPITIPVWGYVAMCQLIHWGRSN